MVWPAVIAAAGGLASVGLQDALSGAATTEQYYNNKRLMQYANEYNDPVNVVSRLERAGLNPKFFLSGGASTPSATASVSPRQVPKVPNIGADAVAAATVTQDLKNLERTEEKIVADTDDAKSSAELKESQQRVLATTDALRRAQLKDLNNSIKFYEKTGQFREADFKRGVLQQFLNKIDSVGESIGEWYFNVEQRGDPTKRFSN